MMTLPEFILELGYPAAAELFEVPQRTIESWARRERYPRQRQARELIARSSGRLDWDGIYGDKPSRAA